MYTRTNIQLVYLGLRFYYLTERYKIKLSLFGSVAVVKNLTEMISKNFLP